MPQIDSDLSKKSPPDTSNDFAKKINESSEYDVTYLSKWRKVPFKIGKKRRGNIQFKYKYNLRFI